MKRFGKKLPLPTEITGVEIFSKTLPAIDEKNHSKHLFSKILPLAGPSIEKLKAFKDKNPYLFLEELIKIEKREKILLTVGLGGGKTTSAILLAFEIAMRRKAQIYLDSKPAGPVLMVFSSNGLAQDVYNKAQGYIKEAFQGSIQVYPYTSNLEDHDKRNIRKNVSNIDILITTWDYYYRTVTKWSPNLQDDSDEEWFNLLLRPAIVFMDELDFLDSFTLTNAAMLVSIWEWANPNVALVGMSGTISNPQEFGSKFFRADDVKLIQGSGRRSETTVSVLKYESPQGSKIDKKELEQGILAETAAEFERFIKSENEQGIIKEVLQEERTKALAFCQTNKMLLDKAESRYSWSHLTKFAHGDLTSKKNSKTLKDFREGKFLFLITTKMLEVGIDIGYVRVGLYFGVPRTLRELLQRLRRVGRDPKDKCFIRIVLRGTNPFERRLIQDPDLCKRFLFNEEVEPFVFSLDNERSLRFGVLLGLAAGMNTRQDLEILARGFDFSEEKLDRIIIDLFFQRSARKLGNRITATRFTSDAIFAFDFRAIEDRFKVLAPEPETGELEQIRNFGIRRVLRQGHVGQCLELEVDDIRKAFMVTETDFDNKRIILKEGYSINSPQYYIQSDVQPTSTIANFPDLQVGLSNVKVTLTSKLIKKDDEDLSYPIDQEEMVYQYESVGVSFELEAKKRVVEVLGAAILTTLRESVSIDPSGLEIGLKKSTWKDGSVLYLIDKTAASGYARKIYEKAKEILQETLQSLKRCRCRMRGCKHCLYFGFFQDSLSYHNPKNIRKAVSALEKLLDSKTEEEDNQETVDKVVYIKPDRLPSFSKFERFLEEYEEVIAVVSDLHLGGRQPRKVGTEVIEEYNFIGRLLDFLAKFLYVVFLGDIIDLSEGKGKDLPKISKFFFEELDRRRMLNKVIIVTGNHDIDYDTLAYKKELIVLSEATIETDDGDVLMVHGDGLGLEGLKGSTYAYAELKRKLVKRGVFGLRDEDWLIFGHGHIPANDPEERVCGLGSWTGQLEDSRKRRFALITMGRKGFQGLEVQKEQDRLVRIRDVPCEWFQNMDRKTTVPIDFHSPLSLSTKTVQS